MIIKTHPIVDHFTNNSRHVVHELNGLFIYAPNDIDLPGLFNSLAINGAKLVRDWSGSGKRISACRELLAMSGYSCELRFNAPHGRRYNMAVYPLHSGDGRRRALAACDGLKNTNGES